MNYINFLREYEGADIDTAEEVELTGEVLPEYDPWVLEGK